MASTIGNILRLARAGIVLAQHGVRFVPAGTKVPLVLHLARAATLPIRALTWPFRIGQPKERRVAGALTSLGPSYIKLGQFLATRADLIGPELARDLGHLQDKLPPFSMREARKAVEEALGGRLEDHFAEFGPPVAAASIAQVHKAVAIDNGVRRDVAVKILRPGIERRFRRDLDSYCLRRPPDRALASAHAAAAPDRRGRHARAQRRDRDGHAPGGRRHLRDGRQHRRRPGAPRRPLPRARRRLAPHLQARADAGMDRRHPDLGPRRARRPPATT